MPRLNLGALAYPAFLALCVLLIAAAWLFVRLRRVALWLLPPRRVRVPQDEALPLRDGWPGLPIDGEPLDDAEQRQAMVLGFLAEVGPDAAEPDYGKREHS